MTRFTVSSFATTSPIGSGLTWVSDRGFSHTQVDSGEHIYPPNQTPILVPDGSFPADTVLREFARRSSALPDDVRRLVTDKISEFVQRKV